MLIVQKFGGTSVANAERLENVANIVIDTYKESNKVVVVVSAQGDTTDDLIEKALEITPNPSKREMDMLLSTGEQQSASLLALAIHKKGFPAISLNAFQVGIHSTSNYSNAKIKKISADRINAELEKNSIVIITGFQGINRYGDITTLGRGGSDTSAVALAAALHADKCEIFTDVDGVYTADPRSVVNARKLDEINYDEMLELASLGAKVLHNRSVELAKKYHIKLAVRSSLTRGAGTIVKEETKVENTYISGLAIDKDVARISIVGIKDEPGMAFKIFSILAKKNISVDIILQSIGRENTKDISFTVTKLDLNESIAVLEAHKDTIGYDHISSDDRVAKLSVVGAGMATNPGCAATMFEALFDAGINIQMISTSEIKISVLVDVNVVDQAANYVHDRFIDQHIVFNS